jgi:hypothetical protein
MMSSFLKNVTVGLLFSTSMMISSAMAHVSLTHRYSFSDGTANDSVGKANGKVVGDVRISDGQAHFAGSPGERIELLANGPDGIRINSFTAVTIEAWYTADKAQLWQRLFDFGASGGLDGSETTGSNNLMYVVTCGDGKGGGICATLSNGSPSFTDQVHAVAAASPLNREVYMAIVVDNSDITLFIDGTQAAQTPLGNHTLAKLSNDYALLGHSLYGFNPSLAGTIREFRIYRGAATATEIAASFEAGPGHPVLGVRKAQ